MTKLLYRNTMGLDNFGGFKKMVNVPIDEDLAMRVAGKRNMVQLSDIIYLKSAKNYTIFKLKDGREILSSKTLRVFEEELAEFTNFVRPHRSYMINLEHVKDLYFNCRGGEILVHDHKIFISRRKAAEFRRCYRKYLSNTGQNVALMLKLKTTIRVS